MLLIPINDNSNFNKTITDTAFKNKCKIQKINKIELDTIDSIYFFGNFSLGSPIHVNNTTIESFYNKFGSEKPIYMYCVSFNTWCLINSEKNWIRISRPPGVVGKFLILHDSSVDINNIASEINLLFL
jgi:hypothetical protein